MSFWQTYFENTSQSNGEVIKVKISLLIMAFCYNTVKEVNMDQLNIFKNYFAVGLQLLEIYVKQWGPGTVCVVPANTECKQRMETQNVNT